MQYSNLLFDIRENVAYITLNRPEAHNSIDLNTAKEFYDATHCCTKDPGVRAVIVTGSGKVFSVGGDLKAFASEKDNLSRYLEELLNYFHAAISCLVCMNPPVIMAVNGIAAGAGMSLACVGDIVLAAESAQFIMAYSKAGLSPDGASTYFLPRVIGFKRALELVLTNRMLSAQEALDWGIVTRVIQNAHLPTEAESIAAQLASGATKALGAAKRLLHSGWKEALETQMQYETETIIDIAHTTDGQEGIMAFVQKRAPNFRGF